VLHTPKPSTKASHNVRAHTRALHQCKPRRQATAVSAKHAAKMCWLTQGPNTRASHKGRQQPRAHSKQLTCGLLIQLVLGARQCGLFTLEALQCGLFILEVFGCGLFMLEVLQCG